MKWDIETRLPFGTEAKWKLDLARKKDLKEFSDKTMPNRKGLHLDSKMEIEDTETGSSFSIHIQKG